MSNKKELDIQIEEQQKKNKKKIPKNNAKTNSKIGSMKRVCCLSLSFAKVAIGNGIGNACSLHSTLHTPHEAEADKYANIF